MIIINCKVELVGPDCVCNGYSVKYMAVSNCDGTCEEWALLNDDGDDSNVAIIVDVQDCVARVNILKNGTFRVKVTYRFESGMAISVVKTVFAYEVTHVMGGTIDSRIKTVPLIQPHPVVKISRPKETQEGSFLKKKQ